MWMTLASLLLWAPGMYASRVSIAISKIRLAVAVGIGAGVLNLLLSIAFVHYLKLGLLGVAGGTLVSVILWSNIFMGFFVCRSCTISPGRFFRRGLHQAPSYPCCTVNRGLGGESVLVGRLLAADHNSASPPDNHVLPNRFMRSA